MTWYAIKGPDGVLIPFTMMDAKRWAWWRLYTSTTAMQCDGSGESDAAIRTRGHRLGYRCVEVQLVEIMPVHVKCDQPGCGWNENTTADAVAHWFRKPCPKCGAGEIINGDDLSTLCTIIGLHVMGLGRIIPSGTGKPGDIHIDTGALRNTTTAGEGNAE